MSAIYTLQSHPTFSPSLHWLRITERIQYKLLSLTYKVLTTTQPPYLYNIIHSMSSQYSLFIRHYSCSATFIILSKCKTDRSFRYVSPCLWNQLPLSVRPPYSGTSSSISNHLFLHPSRLFVFIHHSAPP